MLNILDFGAKPDGITLNTDAIQRAIDKAYETGGDTVLIPRGTFISGSLELKSNVTLMVAAGGILKGSKNIEDYSEPDFYHTEFKIFKCLLYSMNAENVTIKGEGTIDFSSEYFLDTNSVMRTLFKDMEYDERELEETTYSIPENRPSVGIFMLECNNININGINLISSPCYTINLACCHTVRITGIQIKNQMRVPNSDGIHICSCSDVVIGDSVFYCGDDCIAITNITHWDTENVTERIAISNCIMTTRSAAVRIGYQKSRVRDICISNLTVYNSNRGLLISAGENGYVENVLANNLNIKTRCYAGSWWGNGECIVMNTASGGRITNVTITNINAESDNGILLYSEDYNIKNVIIENINLKLTNSLSRPRFNKGIDLQPHGIIKTPENSNPWLYMNKAVDTRIKKATYTTDIDSFDIKEVLNDLKNCEIG